MGKGAPSLEHAKFVADGGKNVLAFVRVLGKRKTMKYFLQGILENLNDNSI
jgi:hypothetical protein